MLMNLKTAKLLNDFFTQLTYLDEVMQDYCIWLRLMATLNLTLSFLILLRLEIFLNLLHQAKPLTKWTKQPYIKGTIKGACRTSL